MPTVRLSKLKVSNFRSYGDVTVDLPPKGLVLVEGRNLETGGSSGAGKSTLFIALRAALGCAPLPATETQAWGSDRQSRVELEFEAGGVECSVVRSGRPSLRTGDATVGSAKQVEEGLRRVLGVSPEVLDALTECPQDDDADFLSKTNAEKQAFLAGPLGFDALERAARAAQSAAKTFSDQLAVARAEERAAAAAVEREEVELAEARRAVASCGPTDSLEADLRQAESLLSHAELRLAWAESASERLEEAAAQAERAARSAAAGEVRAAEEAVAAAAGRTNELATRSDESFLGEEKAADLSRSRAALAFGRTKLAELRAADAAAEAAHRREVSATDVAIGSLRSRLNGLARAEADAARVVAEIRRLEASTCPTCEQGWPGAAKELAKYRDRLRDLTAQLSELLEVRDSKLPALEAKRSQMVRQVDPTLGQFTEAVDNLEGLVRDLEAEAASAMRAAAYEARRAEDAAGATLRVARAAVEAKVAGAVREVRARGADTAAGLSAAQVALSEARGKVDLKRAALSAAAAAGDAARARVARSEKLLGVAQVALESKSAARATVESKSAAESDFARLVGREGFMGAVFEEVLQEVSDETNRRLARLSNASNVSVAFVPEVTKDGSREIRVTVRVAGHETSLRSGCSGGMRSSVRLACRLAVRSVLARRAGVHLAWLCLDEAFNGVDAVSREACYELLAEEAEDSLVLVVDHFAEFKAMFQRTLTLQYEGGVTRLQS